MLGVILNLRLQCLQAFYADLNLTQIYQVHANGMSHKPPAWTKTGREWFSKIKSTGERIASC